MKRIYFSCSQQNWRLLAVFACGFFWGQTWADASAQRSDKKPDPKNFVFIIGIDQYRGNQLPPLPAASKTGKEIAEILRQKYGYRREQVIEMFNENATSRNITERIEWISQQLNRDDSFFAYVAAHVHKGAKGDRFLVPADGNPDEPWTLLSEYDLRQFLTGLQASAVFIVVEGCFTITPVPLEIYKQADAGPVSRRASQILMFCPTPEAPPNARGLFAADFLAGLKNEDNPDSSVTAVGLYFSLQGRLSSSVKMEKFLARAGGDFTFTPSLSTLDPILLQQLGKENPLKARTEAITKLANAVRAQPEERRPILSGQLVSKLHQIVKDPDDSTEVKARAIWALGRLQDRSAIASLTEILTRSSESARSLDGSLRLAAVEALAQIRGNEVLPPLRQALRDDDVEVRLATVHALAKLQDKNALPEILSLVRTDHETDVRQAALEVAPMLATPGDATADQLIPFLQDSSPSVRRETVNALKKLGYSAANAQLIRLLKNDPDDRVRLNTAYALGRLFQESDSQAVEKALSEALKKDKQGTVREAATFSLGQIGGRTAEKRLRDALDAGDPNVGRAAAEALGNLRSQAAVNDLIKLLKHQNWELRRAAAIALGKIGDPKAVEPLLYAVKDENNYVRMAVQNALHEIEAVAKESSLLKALQHPDARVRVEAVEKVAATKNPAMVPHLIRVLADSDYTVQQVAVQGLAKFDDENSWKTIGAALDDANLWRRQGAATALGLLGKPEAVDLLLQHRNDPYSAVRAKVVGALGRIRNASAIAPLIETAEQDRDVAVRLAAVEALGNYLSDANARAVLERLAQADQDPAVRRAAAEVLKRSYLKPN